MPPKKEDMKKKDDKKSEEEQQKIDEEREMVEKELVIGYLKNKLGRYQEHGDRLQVENIKLSEELETQKLNLRDINEFLTNELKARSLTTSALEAKVFELQGLMDEVKKQHDSLLTKLRAEKDREIENLQANLREHEKKAKTTQEFLERKEQMETELEELRSTLDVKVKDYEQKLVDLDRQHIQDREKWKRETAQKIKETKLQMMKLTDNQLEMTTKRTIMENEQMSMELSYQSRQTEKLLTKNQQFLEDANNLRRQLQLSRQTEEELARRNNVYQKTIKSLLSKLTESSNNQADNGALVSELESRIMDLENQLHLQDLQIDEKNFEITTLGGALSQKRSELNAVHDSSHEAAQFVVQCLEDIRDKIVTVVKEEREGEVDDITVVPGKLEELNPHQRERVLAFLLEKLHSHMAGQTAQTQDPALLAALRVSDSLVLPPIPSMRRRGGTGTATISTNVTGQAPPMNLEGLHGTNPVAPVVIAARAAQPAAARQASPDAVDHAQNPTGPASQLRKSLITEQPLPGVNELLSQVMSDMRPWGKKPMEPSNGNSSKRGSGNGMFIKRGTN